MFFFFVGLFLSSFGKLQALDAWGRITVKKDDVAPCDSDWMMPFGDASCASLGHVYMAVKASNRVREHLEIQRENEANVTLHLQKWVKHSPAGEFRCYTNGKRLAFAGQRYPVNAIGGDLKEIGRVLHEIWTRENMGEFICGFLQVDIWLHDDWKSLYILGVAKPKRDAVENAGVFTFEELVEGLEDDEPCVVVRAITDSKAIAPHANVANVGVPIDLHLLKDLIGNDEQKT